MVLDDKIIEFNGRPLFQTAKFKTPFGYPIKVEDLACFFYVKKGGYQVTESNGTFKVGAKEALIKKCSNYIASYQSDSLDAECEIVAIYFYPDILHELYKNEVPSFLKEKLPINPPKRVLANELIEKFINNLFVYFENPTLIDEELAMLKLKELVMILLRSENFANVRAFLSELFSPQQIEFKSIIENNLYSHVTIEELAFISNKSISSFKRTFKKIYNDTPAKYIKNRRLTKAAELLKTTHDSISGIAYDCGFQDHSTFSANFQEKFNCSPTQYRTLEKTQ